MPNNALLAVVGDLTPAEAFAAAEKAFGAWSGARCRSSRSAEPPAPRAQVVIVDRPGSAQTEIRVGHIAIPRTHPDFVPFDMAIRILGGEGANRLFGVLRSERGLTYGASADLNTFRTSGVVVAETDTRSSATGESLRLMVDEFVTLAARDRSIRPNCAARRTSWRATSRCRSRPRRRSPSRCWSRLFYGQSLSEIETYLDRVSQVTPADIQRVARQLLKPDQLSIVLVGDAATFVDQLRAVGFSDFDRIPVAASRSGLPHAAARGASRAPGR